MASLPRFDVADLECPDCDSVLFEASLVPAKGQKTKHFREECRCCASQGQYDVTSLTPTDLRVLESRASDIPNFGRSSLSLNARVALGRVGFRGQTGNKRLSKQKFVPKKPPGGTRTAKASPQVSEPPTGETVSSSSSRPSGDSDSQTDMDADRAARLEAGAEWQGISYSRIQTEDEVSELNALSSLFAKKSSGTFPADSHKHSLPASAVQKVETKLKQHNPIYKHFANLNTAAGGTATISAVKTNSTLSRREGPSSSSSKAVLQNSPSASGPKTSPRAPSHRLGKEPQFLQLTAKHHWVLATTTVLHPPVTKQEERFTRLVVPRKARLDETGPLKVVNSKSTGEARCGVFIHELHKLWETVNFILMRPSGSCGWHYLDGPHAAKTGKKTQTSGKASSTSAPRPSKSGPHNKATTKSSGNSNSGENGAATVTDDKKKCTALGYA